jgi:hypothetical protein
MREDNTTKPIWIILVDGSTDGNPRYPKPMAECVKLFKANDLDALFMACYAPGQSAFNPTERRMAPLSRDLCGVIIPHDVCGTHLDENGKTIDFELEEQNFQKAGEILASIWNETKIDNFEVIAEYKEVNTGEYNYIFIYTRQQAALNCRLLLCCRFYRNTCSIRIMEIYTCSTISISSSNKKM